MKKLSVVLALILALALIIGVLGCGGGKKYYLTIVVSPSGGGTTSPAVGTYEYKKDASVTITATPVTGYQFVNWSGGSTDSTATSKVTMTSNKSVTANFSKIQYTLTIAKVGNGTTDPTVGAHTYDTGAVVNITATPATGSQFDNWSGDASGTNATVSVTMTANKTVTANFSKIQYTLTIAVSGNGTTNPAAGTHTYDSGTVVSITATPDSASKFDSWGGDATGTTATTTVTMTSNKSVIAYFILTQVTIFDDSIIIQGDHYWYKDLAAGSYNVDMTSDDAVTVTWIGGVDQGYNSGETQSYHKQSVPALQSTTFKLYNPGGIFSNPDALVHLKIVKVQ